MDYQIIDDALPEYQHKAISELMLGNDVAWYFSGDVSGADDKEDGYNMGFTHMFYRNDIWTSGHAKILEPILDILEPKAIVRIKGNLATQSPRANRTGWHVDYPFECKTAVYYVNTNNGYTEFKTGERVESVANRLVIFDSRKRHTGVTHTDVPARVLINFNYF